MTDQAPDETVRISPKRAGPIFVQGPVVVLGYDGEELTPPVGKTPGVFKLCGCGLSQNKPFCDSSHKNRPPQA